MSNLEQIKRLIIAQEDNKTLIGIGTPIFLTIVVLLISNDYQKYQQAVEL